MSSGDPAVEDLKQRMRAKMAAKYPQGRPVEKPVVPKMFKNKQTGQMFEAMNEKDIPLFSRNPDIEEVTGGKKRKRSTRKRLTKKRKTVRKH